MKFNHLLYSIQQTHDALHSQAVAAINRSLTIRNWLIGFYIVEFEQKGEDRAKYGEGLLKEIAKVVRVPGLSLTNLKLNRQFYLTYLQMGQTVSDFLKDNFGIGQTSDQLEQIGQTLSAKSVQPDLVYTKSVTVPPEKILNRLSFSHIAELLPIDDPLKRAFYEVECMKGTWSVRELKRQIGSLYFERSSLSQNPEKLSAMVAEKAEPLQPADIIKSVYTFEFLGLGAKDVIEESDLETALLNHLQAFLLEMGRGYCFEARQQKILIGDEYFFIDMVFYNRILKCHVLVDLKVEAFTHHNAGQLNTYLNYCKKK